jgi:hypothetical protein
VLINQINDLILLFNPKSSQKVALGRSWEDECRSQSETADGGQLGGDLDLNSG